MQRHWLGFHQQSSSDWQPSDRNRIMLEVNQPDRLLYLAVPLETYDFFQSQFAQVAVERYQLKLIVYEPTTEEIVQWRS